MPNQQRCSRQRDRNPSRSNDNLLESNYSDEFKQLCPFAAKGICRFGPNQCTYQHTPCVNYDSCYIRGCLFSHAFRRSNSMSSILCRNGVDCFTFDCKYRHPTGWKACPYGINCRNSICENNHPPESQKQFIHAPKPENVTSPRKNSLSTDITDKRTNDSCPESSLCDQYDCQLNHPQDRILQLQKAASSKESKTTNIVQSDQNKNSHENLSSLSLVQHPPNTIIQAESSSSTGNTTKEVEPAPSRVAKLIAWFETFKKKDVESNKKCASR